MIIFDVLEFKSTQKALLSLFVTHVSLIFPSFKIAKNNFFLKIFDYLPIST